MQKIKISLLISRKLFKKKIEMHLGNIKSDFGGGCGLEKAFLMARLIKSENMKRTCDIGIYRGRSFFPQVISHKMYSNGIVYGVDPFLNTEAIQKDNQELNEEMDAFLNKIDLNLIFKEVNDYRTNNNFEENSLIIRKRSDEAAFYFKKLNIVFDMVHIDGNHDRDMVLSDVNLYYPLLKKKGFIIMDDISWDSVASAKEKLTHSMKVVFEGKNQTHDYAILWNGKGFLKFFILKLKIFLYFVTSKLD